MVAGRGLAASDDAASAHTDRPLRRNLAQPVWRRSWHRWPGDLARRQSGHRHRRGPRRDSVSAQHRDLAAAHPDRGRCGPVESGGSLPRRRRTTWPTSHRGGSAREELVQIARRLAEQFPQTNAEFTANVVPLRDYLVHDARRALYVLLGCVAFVLLIACANVANLLLVRAVSREAEISLRAALGASVVRVLRQLVTEGVLLSIGGAVGGVALAVWAVGAVRAFGPADVPRLTEVTIDGRALAVAALVSVATGVLFGLVPVRHLARANIAEMLGGGARRIKRAARHATDTQRAQWSPKWRSPSCYSSVRGCSRAAWCDSTQVDSGFRPENVVTMECLTSRSAKYPWDRHQRAFAKAVVEPNAGRCTRNAERRRGVRPAARREWYAHHLSTRRSPTEPPGEADGGRRPRGDRRILRDHGHQGEVRADVRSK